MSRGVEGFCRGLLASIELYLELQELRELGFTEDEITGWLETYAEEILKYTK